MSIITLTTDFGPDSAYVATLKGAIYSLNAAATIVDISHAVPPQDVRQAALLLDEVADFYPPGTIHVAVVDPGVGTSRALLYARVAGSHFLAPDNGLLSRLLDRMPAERIIELTEPAYWAEKVSATFHGRDILAPVAARISLGLDPELLGRPRQTSESLDWPTPEVSEARIDGVVLEIDAFGNLITNISSELFTNRPTDRRVCIVFNIYETWGIHRTYAEQPQGTLVALIGSHNRLELALVGDNLAQRLGVQLGAPVVVAWE